MTREDFIAALEALGATDIEFSAAPIGTAVSLVVKGQKGRWAALSPLPIAEVFDSALEWAASAA